MRILCAGWENRCAHPNLIGPGNNDHASCHEQYNAGGIGGIGYLYVVPDILSTSHPQQSGSMYFLPGVQSEIYLNIDMYIDGSGLWNYYSNWQSRIWWDFSEGVNVGYVGFDVITNQFYYSWDGWSGSNEGIIQFDRWYNIGLYLKIRLDGRLEIALKTDGFLAFSVVSPNPMAVSFIGRIGFGFYDNMGFPHNEGVPTYWDNLKVNDTIGPVDDSWPAPSVFIGLPILNNDIVQYWPFPGPPNWQNIDDLTPDDVDYNYTFILGEMDIFGFTDCPAEVFDTINWHINRFLVNTRHRLENKILPQGFTPDIRIGGVDYFLNFEESYNLYACYQQWLDLDPSTSGVWDKAVVNDMTVGTISDS